MGEKVKLGLSWVEYNGGWNTGMLECGMRTGMMEWLEWWNGVHANYLELLKKDCKSTFI